MMMMTIYIVMPLGALTAFSTRGKSSPSQCQALVQWALVFPWVLKRLFSHWKRTYRHFPSSLLWCSDTNNAHTTHKSHFVLSPWLILIPVVPLGALQSASHKRCSLMTQQLSLWSLLWSNWSFDQIIVDQSIFSPPSGAQVAAI